VVLHEREWYKRLQREQQRLSRSSQVSEERVADAERVNRDLQTVINKLRHGRSEFLHQMGRLTDRESQMAADMKHFAQAAHASLDEKEKLEARLKRQQFDYEVEGKQYDKLLNALQDELFHLDGKIADSHLLEEHNMQEERRDGYRTLKSRRDVEQKRELRLGYLQNQVRGQEMEFQRLHRIIGVRFTPEKPESVNEIISASLKNEERNSSLLGYVSVQTSQIEALEDEVRRMTAEADRLLAERQKEEAKGAQAGAGEKREARALEATTSAVAIHEKALAQLCWPVESIFKMMACSPPSDDGGLFALKGCRADTLVDYIREVGEAVKQLRAQALPLVSAFDEAQKPADDDDGENALPMRSTTEVLRSFLAPDVISPHPSVAEVRRELELAAQKHTQKGEDSAMATQEVAQHAA